MRILILHVLSCLIAVCGFITNTKELLLAAMLISPVFTPTNASNLIFGSVFCMVFGYATAQIIRLKQDTEEMRSRVHWNTTFTSTFVNYIIPIAAGVILALAKTSDPIMLAAPALALSVMPPLVTSGLYYGMTQKYAAFQSMKLAVVNIVLATGAYMLTKRFV